VKKRSESVTKRMKKQKEALLELLTKTPIVTLVCEKTGVGRATYYRWKKEDSKFLKSADEAIENGNLLINDLAESQLLGAIRDGNMTAIIFWLKHHHPSYETRIELRQAYERSEEKLSKHQEQVLKQALKLTSINKTPKLKGGANEGKEDNQCRHTKTDKE